MIDTVVCYLEHNDKILMLYRNKKKDDLNKNKYVGIGGKIEKNELPLDAMIREFKEETNLKPLNLKEIGFIDFFQDGKNLGMHIFKANNFEGEIFKDCNEGTLEWIDKKELMNLNIWEGDRIFFPYVLSKKSYPYFKMKFVYNNDELIEYHKLNTMN